MSALRPTRQGSLQEPSAHARRQQLTPSSDVELAFTDTSPRHCHWPKFCQELWPSKGRVRLRVAQRQVLLGLNSLSRATGPLEQYLPNRLGQKRVLEDRLRREFLVFLSSGPTGLSQGLWFKSVGVVDSYGQKAKPGPSELLQE